MTQESDQNLMKALGRVEGELSQFSSHMNRRLDRIEAKVDSMDQEGVDQKVKLELLDATTVRRRSLVALAGSALALVLAPLMAWFFRA